MFDRLYHIANKEKADIVVGGHCDMDKGVAVKTKIHPLAGKTIHNKKDIESIRKKLYGHEIDDPIIEAFPMAVWIAIYRRKMLIDNNLYFKEILSEDTIFNLTTYKYAKIISFTDSTDYCYRTEGQPSIMRTFSNKKLIRYRDFLKTLYKMAQNEYDETCQIRAERTAIDYCRLYVGLVNNSNESFKKKKMYVKEFVENKEICGFWKEYPVKTLPLQQRLFQEMIQGGWYSMVLILDSFRQVIKRILRK